MYFKKINWGRDKTTDLGITNTLHYVLEFLVVVNEKKSSISVIYSYHVPMQCDDYCLSDSIYFMPSEFNCDLWYPTSR